MELDPVSKQLPPDEPELDLYTIPSHSSWFLWDEIHETEKKALKEFFDWKSPSRTPKIYKEYRDFIINKYREDPSRKLTFTEVRKSLVGDVSLLHKVFGFLEKWGLINFGVKLSEGEGRVTVKVEEAVPNAVRVVANPNDLKPLSAFPWVGNGGGGNACGVMLPPLASYTNVFSDVKKEGLVCSSCGENCDSGHHKYKEGEFLLCVKCFEDGKYGENRLKEDFKYNKPVEKSNAGVEWTEAETLLLLESIVKHGDDWDKVAQSVQTKSKADCIAKLIDLPFGEVSLGLGYKNGKHSGSLSNLKPGQLSSAECQETIKTESQRQDGEQTNDIEQNGDAANQGPPLKRQCVASLSDASSLIHQASALSTLVGPHITAAAAEAAVTVLCEETSCSKEIFNAEDDSVTNSLQSPAINCETARVFLLEDSEMVESQTESASQDALNKKDGIPPTLQIRAAIATGLGAASARAKLLADEEDREIEHLLATIIETQLKKLHCKMKTVEALELLMEKEYAETKEEEELLLEERIDIIQKTLSSGVPRWKDHPSPQF